MVLFKRSLWRLRGESRLKRIRTVALGKNVAHNADGKCSFVSTNHQFTIKIQIDRKLKF
jgi:hypothetical protein